MPTSKSTSKKIDSVFERTRSRYANISSLEAACRLLYQYEKNSKILRTLVRGHPLYARILRYALNKLWLAAQFMDRTVKETPATIEYYDGVVAQRLHVREPIVGRLLLIANSGLRRLDFVHLMEEKDAWDIATIVRNLPKIQQVAEKTSLAEEVHPVLRAYIEAYKHAVNTGKDKEFVELTRQLLATAIAYMPDDDQRFLPLFRSLIPCCWCGREAPINSYGWELRPARFRSRYVKLPCCPQCNNTIDEPKGEILLDGLLSYTLALEQYAQRVDVTALQRVIVDAIEP